jgi:hypothetical protein
MIRIVEVTPADRPLLPVRRRAAAARGDNVAALRTNRSVLSLLRATRGNIEVNLRGPDRPQAIVRMINQTRHPSVHALLRSQK